MFVSAFTSLFLFYASCVLGTDPSVRNGWDARWINPVCSVTCGSGIRTLQVVCMQDWALVNDSFCDADMRPSGTEPCYVECVHVDPKAGDDSNSGGQDSPLRSVAACVARAGTTRDDSAPVTRCLLASGRYTEFPVDLSGRHRLIIEPVANTSEGAVIFDGTDALPLQWTPHSRLGGGFTSNVLGAVPRLEALIVGGSALQRATDFQTAVQPCFGYHGASGDIAVPRPFSCADAEEHFTTPFSGTNFLDLEAERAVRRELGLPAFWSDAHGKLHVALGHGNKIPEVRLKNVTRHVAFTMDGGTRSERIWLKGLHFFGSTISLVQPASSSQYHSDIRVMHCRFLYHPAAVHMSTTSRGGRGAGRRIEVTGNILEFGEGTLSYKASAAVVSGNLFVGNSLANRGDFSVKSISLHDTLVDNTMLYNGDHGGHFGWARGNVARRNLWLGQSYLSTWHDSAVHHVQIGAQTGFVCEDSWILGPSNIKSIRLDTSNTATEPGRHSTIRNNVFLGHDRLTLKGDEHVFEHNTGDRMTLVAAWGAINNHNANTWARYNAIPDYHSRGSSAPGGAVPGHASLNACSDLSICNPANDSLPVWAAQQFRVGGTRETQSEICSFLTSCHPEGRLNVYEQQRANLNSLQPKIVQPLSHAQVRALDFRPASGETGEALSLNCGATEGCTGSGNIIGFGAGAKPDGWANYLGAHRPNGERPQTPGCWAVGCRRPDFPLESVLNTPPLDMWDETQPPHATRCNEMMKGRRCVRGNVVVKNTMNVSSCQAFCERLGNQGRSCCQWFAKTKACTAHTGNFRFRSAGTRKYAAVCTKSDNANRRLQQFHTNILKSGQPDEQITKTPMFFV